MILNTAVCAICLTGIMHTHYNIKRHWAIGQNKLEAEGSPLGVVGTIEVYYGRHLPLPSSFCLHVYHKAVLLNLQSLTLLPLSLLSIKILVIIIG